MGSLVRKLAWGEGAWRIHILHFSYTSLGNRQKALSLTSICSSQLRKKCPLLGHPEFSLSFHFDQRFIFEISHRHGFFYQMATPQPSTEFDDVLQRASTQLMFVDLTNRIHLFFLKNTTVCDTSILSPKELQVLRYFWTFLQKRRGGQKKRQKRRRWEGD